MPARAAGKAAEEKGIGEKGVGERLRRGRGILGGASGMGISAGAFYQISLMKWINVVKPIGSETTGVVPYVS